MDISSNAEDLEGFIESIDRGQLKSSDWLESQVELPITNHLIVFDHGVLHWGGGGVLAALAALII